MGVIPVNQWGAGMMQDEDRKPIISKKMAVGVKVPRKTAPRKNAGKGQAKRFVSYFSAAPLFRFFFVLGTDSLSLLCVFRFALNLIVEEVSRGTSTCKVT